MMGYEKKLTRSFTQAEPQKLTYGLLLVCFMVLLTYLSISKPYDALLSTLSFKLSSSGSLQPDLMMNTDIINSTTPEQKGLENATIESKTSCRNISNTTSDLCQSNVMQKNSSSTVPKFDPPPTQVVEVKDIQASELAVENKTTLSNYTADAITGMKSKFKEDEGNVKGLGLTKDELVINPEDWKSMCDYSNRRSDVCELFGDVRIHINHPSVILVAKHQSNDDTLKIRPYARKSDLSAMSSVGEISLKLSEIHDAPQCTHNHSVPAIIFSVGGYTGNYFHDFTDVLLPLFQTSHHFKGEVQFLISDFRSWWINKYLPIFKSLSHYEILNFNKSNNESVHCFTQTVIGLRSHNDLNINPSMSKYGHSMVEFTEFLRKTYLLPRHAPIKIQELGIKKPRLLVIARSHTRKFMNLEKIVRTAKKLGFEVEVSEAEPNVARFARVVNTCDVMMGVHGAGLTNLVFLPTNAILIQVVPLGKLDWISRTYFKEPAISMKLRYLEYDIKEEESTLTEIYGKDDPVLRDPYSIHKLGWLGVKAVYLEKQNVKLNVRRFRAVLLEALKLLRQKIE